MRPMNEHINLGFVKPSDVWTPAELKQIRAAEEKLRPMVERALGLMNGMPEKIRGHLKKLEVAPEAVRDLGTVDDFRRQTVAEHNALRRAIAAGIHDVHPLLEKACRESAKVISARLRSVQEKLAALHAENGVPFSPDGSPLEKALHRAGELLIARADSPRPLREGLSLTPPSGWLTGAGLGHLLAE